MLQKRRIVIGLILLVVVAGTLAVIFGPSLFASVAYPLPRQYQKAVAEESLKNGISPNFLAALIYTESNWRPDARSSAGAVGLTQFTQSTARAEAARRGISPFTPNDLITNPEMAIAFGAGYIANAINRYGDKKLGLIAYNGGGGAVNAYKAGYPVRGTVGYAQTVIAREAMYDRIYGKWWERTNLPDLSAAPKGTVDLIASIPVLDFWRNLLFSQRNLPSEEKSAEGVESFTDFWRVLLPGE